MFYHLHCTRKSPPCLIFDRKPPPSTAIWPAAVALRCATGHEGKDFNKPVITITICFTRILPSHEHPKDLGQLGARERGFETSSIKRFLAKWAVLDNLRRDQTKQLKAIRK
jgi:hypothetical protein